MLKKSYLPPSSTLLITLIFSLIAHILLAYSTIRSDFGQLLMLFVVLFTAYGLTYRELRTAADYRWVIGAAVLFRFVLIFAFPNLSDDVYRFVWDGRLLVQGVSPFAYLPIDFVEGTYQATKLVGIDCTLYEQLNSPLYFTIYPPVCQGVFALACWLFPTSVYGAACVMKACLFAFECGSIYLLHRLLKNFSLPTKTTVLYALNPLVIAELVGNIHFEAAMIFFVLLAIFWLHSFKNVWKSALAMAGAVCAKLIPLLFLPLFFKFLGFKKWLWYCIIVGLATLLAFIPLLSVEIVGNLMSSVGLYFQKFEFNAGIYYLLRWLGFQVKGYNVIAIIGPLLGGLTFLGIICLAIFPYKKIGRLLLSQKLLFALLIYFSFATIVHPWYVCSLVALCVLTPYRFPILWSAMIVLTYFTYATDAYRENLWLVALEYLVVWLYLIGEIGDIRQEI